ncbi:haloacid dehalogenase type II [Larsenimonas salina]|uniref:haloacid dehalogenase type II n=1 Tax=Larsenimonas salina TaxID=1295565 RepID=UPI00207301AF|nr:haloacid dehalogenase type II [Larsenimonas salina]MCM5704992.1 haloacid dehalogenase type II [Larsenimonas salina]
MSTEKTSQPVLAFDVYGTLLDTGSLADMMRDALGDQAEAVSEAWRARQLNLAFRRGLMGRYVDFALCTQDALNAVLEEGGHQLDEAQRKALLKGYGTLPPHSDTLAGLKALRTQNVTMVAFSNGTADAMQNVLTQAGLIDQFDALVSVDDIKRFKPDPQVYLHLMRTMASSPDNTWLVSSNAWDIQGARHVGLNAAWVHRDRSVIEDEALAPTHTVESLEALAAWWAQ